MMEKNKKIKCEIVAITHRLFKDGKRKKGGFDKILDYFSQKNKIIFLIEHPLRGLKETEDQKWRQAIISIYKNNEFTEIRRYKTPNLPNSFSWIYEVFFNIYFILFKIESESTFMAADPLNCLTGVILKFKFKKTYFHVIDYSRIRFDNHLFNKIYHLILNIDIKFFDLIGVVSLRIKEELINLYNCSSKIFYIPNSPVYKDIDIPTKKENLLICMGNSINESFDYELIIQIIYELKKRIKDIKLFSVGGLDNEKYVNKIKNKIKELNLEDNFVFTGYLNQKELEEFLLKSKIGLCFYNQTLNYYIYYGDSLKMREYALYGIPTICKGDPATKEEMLFEKTGFSVDNLTTAVSIIEELLNNNVLYEEYQSNCLSWAKKMDKNKILDELNNKLFY